MCGVPFKYNGIKSNHIGKFMQIYRHCLNPGLYRKDFIRGAHPLIKEYCNAESQFFPQLCPNQEILDFVNKWEYLIWTGNWKNGEWRNRKRIVDNIGRRWRMENKILRYGLDFKSKEWKMWRI